MPLWHSLVVRVPICCRAISSCTLWLFKVSDVYRMSAMQPSLVANIRRTFLKRMEDALRALPPDMWCARLAHIDWMIDTCSNSASGTKLVIVSCDGGGRDARLCLLL